MLTWAIGSPSDRPLVSILTLDLRITVFSAEQF